MRQGQVGLRSEPVVRFGVEASLEVSQAGIRLVEDCCCFLSKKFLIIFLACFVLISVGSISIWDRMPRDLLMKGDMSFRSEFSAGNAALM